LFEVHFWRFALERAIKTFAQTALALLGAGALNILTADWTQVLGVSAGAFVLSILTSVGSAGVSGGSPSLVKEKD
jgi:hypothetical protein